MRTFLQSLLATAIIAFPASGSPRPPAIVSEINVTAALQPPPAATDLCGQAMAQAAVAFAWHVSTFLFCPTGVCIPLIEASGYALLLSTAYAITVCAI